ncbi:hypothetical protein JCM10450v2_005990 [Rhodotorula kratochvilovae]
MAEQLDSHTLAFLSRLPLVLAPLPPLSSSASHALSSLDQPVQASALYTKCAACRAELVGGLTASYWTERGELWATCGGCGATSRRPREDDASSHAGRQTGKAALERVKKRRRVEVKRRDEALHPKVLAMAASREQPATPAAFAQLDDASSTTALRRQASAQAKKDRKPAPSPAPSPFVPASTPTTIPSRPLPPPVAAATSAPPSQPPSRTSTATSRASSARATPAASISASPAPPPSSSASPAPLASSASATKKRKRPKQLSGLAELLEAKKKREKEAKVGGAGLADFLQGL